MSRLPAIFCAILVAALALGAVRLQRHPPAKARLTAWPITAHMPGFGDGGLLGPSEIEDLTEYVIALNGAPHDGAAAARAIPLFQTHCALCHGLGGEGSELLGTPDLTRGQFRNIRAPQDIRQQILRGTDGRGPIRESRARTPAG
jgi:hypothetical protein